MTTSFSASPIIVIILVAICLAVPFTLAGRKNKSSESSKDKTEEYIVGNVKGGHKSANKKLKKGEEVAMTLPDGELFTGVDFAIDGHPYVGLFNTKIMELSPKDIFGWYLSLRIEYPDTVNNGMPTHNNTVRMEDFSDELSTKLAISKEHPNAFFLGRITGEGHTQMMWYVNNPELAHKYLQGLIKSKKYPFEFDYQMNFDGEWKEAYYWLDPILQKKN